MKIIIECDALTNTSHQILFDEIWERANNMFHGLVDDGLLFSHEIITNENISIITDKNGD